MRILEVGGDDGYGAWAFERCSYGNSELAEVWERAWNSPNHTFDDDFEGTEFWVKALEFGDVDLDFIFYFKGEFIDYDYMKDHNFYTLTGNKE